MLLVALAIEFIDELVFGTWGAALPLIRHDLHFGYGQLGLLSAVPLVVGNLIELPVGVLSAAGHRRRLFVTGGVAFTIALVAIAVAPSFGLLLVAFTLLFPASGAFVGLGQTVLLDAAPEAHDHAMARWTLAGSIGALTGPALLAGAVAADFGWRAAFAVMAGAAGCVLVGAVRRREFGHSQTSEPVSHAVRAVFSALRDPDVRRWLVLLEACDGLVDVLTGFIAVYFVDVVHVSPAAAALAVAVQLGSGLAGDALLVVVLRRRSGTAILRVTVLVALVAYPALLVVPGYRAKLFALAVLGLVTAPWYTLINAALYTNLPDRSGVAFTLSTTASLAAGAVPAAIGFIAQRYGLTAAMWTLTVSPAILLVGLFPGTRRSKRS